MKDLKMLLAESGDEEILKLKESIENIFCVLRDDGFVDRRPVATPESISTTIAELISTLYYRVSQKGANTFVSSHEILGIVSEEFDELKDSVRKNDLDEFEEELFDVAVACIWGLVSKKLGVHW